MFACKHVSNNVSNAHLAIDYMCDYLQRVQIRQYRNNCSLHQCYYKCACINDLGHIR